MAFVDIDKGEQVALATETGDDGTLTDKTACLTDDTSATSCVEVKAGIGIRFEINIDPASIDQSQTMEIRIGVNSIMAAGTVRFAPYSDANSINNSNGITTGSIDCAGLPASCPGDVIVALTGAFIDDAVDLGGGVFAIRMFENGSGAKIKTGELDRDLTQRFFTIDGVTRDKAEAVKVSCEYLIQRRIALGPPEVWTLSKSGVSNGTTGVFTEQVTNGVYRVAYMKHETPETMDISPPLIVFIGTASDDILALGKFHNLANDDQMHVYKRGTAALPVGLVEDVIHFVVSLSGDTCKLSLTQAGPPINITVDGEGWLVGKPETS